MILFSLEKKEVTKLNNIKLFRKKLSLTLAELSKKSSVAISYINTLENDSGGETNPTKETMVRISSALGKTVPEVFFTNKEEMVKLDGERQAIN
jgi:transcriptional regulator with XRE-family HTH domain